MSSAVLVYGLSFVYGVAGTTDLGGIASALRTGHPLILLGMLVLASARGGFSLWIWPWIPMLVLASARELILLFVAFELMSIPLYYLAGFLKREPEAVEAALKFFLVGTVSSAVLVYGLSFIYGMAGTTDIRGVAKALTTGHPMLLLGMEIQEAIERPRFVAGPIDLGDVVDQVRIESRVPEPVRAALTRKGHKVTPVSDWFLRMGHAHGITLDNGTLRGGADPRGDGAAIGF